jgi:hypothetical protein
VLTIEPQDSRGASGGDSGGTETAITDFGTAADGGYEDEGCEKAAVVRNPTVSGPAAALTCADGNSDIVDRHADETCSSDISDCDYADPDGMAGDNVEYGGNENGGRTNDISFDYGGGYMRGPDNPPHSGNTGGRGYIGVI